MRNKKGRGLTLSRAILNTTSNLQNFQQNWNNKQYGPHGLSPINSPHDKAYYIRSSYINPNKYYLYNPKNPQPLHVTLMNTSTNKPVSLRIKKPTPGVIRQIKNSLYI